MEFLRGSNFQEFLSLQDFLVVAFKVEAILHANKPFTEERDL